MVMYFSGFQGQADLQFNAILTVSPHWDRISLNYDRGVQRRTVIIMIFYSFNEQFHRAYHVTGTEVLLLLSTWNMKKCRHKEHKKLGLKPRLLTRGSEPVLLTYPLNSKDVYVYVYVYLYVYCVYVRVYMGLCMYMHIYVCMCMYMCMYVCTCLSVYIINVYVHACVYVYCIYVYVHVYCMYVCMYLYLCTCMCFVYVYCIYVYVYVYYMYLCICVCICVCVCMYVCVTYTIKYILARLVQIYKIMRIF